jgi:hypothetical protein
VTWPADVRSESFTEAEVDKTFLSYQKLQLVNDYRHQTLMMGAEMVPEILVIFNQLTQLMYRGFMYYRFLPGSVMMIVLRCHFVYEICYFPFVLVDIFLNVIIVSYSSCCFVLMYIMCFGGAT